MMAPTAKGGRPRPIAQLGPRRRIRAATKHNDAVTGNPRTLLGLPGELRNLIYELTMRGDVVTRSPIDPAVPWTCRWPGRHWKLMRNGSTPHPLAQTCRRIRSEFSSFLRGYRDPNAYLTARVFDFNFNPLLHLLQRHPPQQTPCNLLIYPMFTKNGVWHYNGLSHWLQLCHIPDNGSNTHKGTHNINGVEYYIKFAPPPGSYHHLKRSLLPFSQMIQRTLQQRDLDLWRRSLPMVSDISRVLTRWELNSDAIGSNPDLHGRLKYERGISKFSQNRRPGWYCPKRYGEPSERQEKRRKLHSDGRWKVAEGFDRYGNHDEDYEKLLEGLRGINL